MEETKLAIEKLEDKMLDKLFILKVVASLHKGITVAEFNQRFGGMTQDQLKNYVHLMVVTRRQMQEIEVAR